MKLLFKETNITLDPRVRRELRAKLLKLSRWLRRLGTAVKLEIEVALTSRHHRKGKIYHAEGTLHLPKKTLRAEADREDIVVAFDVMRQELEREIERYKMSKEELGYRQARLLKRKTRMSALAWRGSGREEEQESETRSE
jgi:ribosomal subunit interface protein